MKSNGFRLKLTLQSVDGRTGTLEITGATGLDDSTSDGGPCHWDRDGDDETASARFDFYWPDDADGHPRETEVIHGDEWRTLEDTGRPLTELFAWLSHPNLSTGLAACLTAAIEGCDPDGWTDAHERVIELELEVKQLRLALCKASTQMRDLVNGYAVDDLHETPEETMNRLNRLVPGHEVRAL